MGLKIYYEKENSNMDTPPETLEDVGLMLRTPRDTIRCFCTNKMVIEIPLDKFMAVVEDKYSVE